MGQSNLELYFRSADHGTRNCAEIASKHPANGLRQLLVAFSALARVVFLASQAEKVPTPDTSGYGFLGRLTMGLVSGLPRAIAELQKLRFLGWCLAIVSLSAGLAVGAWLERGLLLQGLADLWIVSDPVTRGDAVAVLGGGIDLRPFVAADLYRKGFVGKILISRVAEGRSVTSGELPGHTELNRTVLLNLGVPETAIETFGTANRNTMEEALALRDWAERNGSSVLIIPTDIFAARRVSWIFRREFFGSDVRIEVPSFDAENYTRTGWWKTEQGLIAFQNEVLKYIYYRVKY